MKTRGRSSKAQQRGATDFKAGKELKDNPYLLDPLVALSSWWEAGFLKAKKKARIANIKERHDLLENKKS